MNPENVETVSIKLASFCKVNRALNTRFHEDENLTEIQFFLTYLNYN